MANFSTHVTGAVVAGVVSSFVFASTGLIAGPELVTAVAVVVLGGLFPDIDSDYSTSIKLIFNVLGTFIGSLFACYYLGRLGIVPAIGVLLLCYCVMRYVLIVPFREWTVHRGMAHSSVMAVLLSLVVVLLCFYVLGMTAVQAWMMGLLFGIGYITHLLLDELYSVDLANQTIKRSFGSAMKLFDPQQPFQYIGVVVLIGIAILFVPPATDFIQILHNTHFIWISSEVNIWINELWASSQ